MILGSCLCGQVKFELDGSIERINNCHCSMCVATYQSSESNAQGFCRNCSSNMPVLEDREAHVTIPAGSVKGGRFRSGPIQGPGGRQVLCEDSIRKPDRDFQAKKFGRWHSNGVL